MQIDAPLVLHQGKIQGDWIDYNGHMNVAYYVLVFDNATDALLDFLGMDEDYRKRTGFTTYVLETHVTYRNQLLEGDSIHFHTQLLDHDHKRMHFFHFMYHSDKGYLAATTELLFMNIDTRIDRSAVIPEEVQQTLANVMESHRALERPADAGHVMGIRRA